MQRTTRLARQALLLVWCTAIAAGQVQPQGATASGPTHVFFRVQAGASVPGPVSGRLLIFLKQGSGDKQLNAGAPDTWMAAMEVRGLAPGASVDLDADQIAYPKPFSSLSAGTYEAQAVLDVNHSYNYSGRSEQDWISSVVPLTDWKPGSGAAPVLSLDHRPEPNAAWAPAFAKLKESATPDVAQLVELESPSLSRFWGHPVKVKAWVILPPGYAEQSAETFPAAYWTHGFGGNIDYSLAEGLSLRQRMKDGKMPPMIWVMLDESIPQGTHEFADSVNNGPWGTALTAEFMPYLETKFRMDARRSGRLLNGHSSGGWATLQLQVNYPKVFGGTWSTSPDPSDFHDVVGTDIYAPNANMYRRADGTSAPIVRDKGKVVANMEDYARQEEVQGPYGGQMASLEWVFSPKGPSGAPEPMFDRKTGAVDPKVVAYWREHYDLAHITEATWPQRGEDLKGRIHLIVGDADTFYLDGSAHKFEAVLARLGAEPHFTYLPERTHSDLYRVDKDPRGLFDQIGAEMYVVSRPGMSWKK